MTKDVKIMSLQELADSIKRIPQEDRPQALGWVNAYLQGFMAGQASKRVGA